MCVVLVYKSGKWKWILWNWNWKCFVGREIVHWTLTMKENIFISVAAGGVFQRKASKMSNVIFGWPQTSCLKQQTIYMKMFTSHYFNMVGGMYVLVLYTCKLWHHSDDIFVSCGYKQKNRKIKSIISVNKAF